MQPEPFVELVQVLPHDCLDSVLRIGEEFLLAMYGDAGTPTTLVWMRIANNAERDVWRRMLMHLGGLQVLPDVAT